VEVVIAYVQETARDPARFSNQAHRFDGGWRYGAENTDIV
jgi:hypothetical protein